MRLRVCLEPLPDALKSTGGDRKQSSRQIGGGSVRIVSVDRGQMLQQQRMSGVLGIGVTAG